jgi:hypothetical protein
MIADTEKLQVIARYFVPILIVEILYDAGIACVNEVLL